MDTSVETLILIPFLSPQRSDLCRHPAPAFAAHSSLPRPLSCSSSFAHRSLLVTRHRSCSVVFHGVGPRSPWRSVPKPTPCIHLQPTVPLRTAKCRTTNRRSMCATRMMRPRRWTTGNCRRMGTTHGHRHDDHAEHRRDGAPPLSR